MLKILNKRELDNYKHSHGLNNSQYYLDYCDFDPEDKKFKIVDKSFTQKPLFKLYKYYIDICEERIVSHTILECNQSHEPIFFMFEHKNKTYRDKEIYDCINELDQKGELSFDKVYETCLNRNIIDQIYTQDHQIPVQL